MISEIISDLELAGIFSFLLLLDVDDYQFYCWWKLKVTNLMLKAADQGYQLSRLSECDNNPARRSDSDDVADALREVVHIPHHLSV